MLENRVSNGDELDTVEEATLSKLNAAHESKKKHEHESYHRNVDDWKVLEKRISNGDKLTTAEEATLKLQRVRVKKSTIVRDYEEKS